MLLTFFKARVKHLLQEQHIRYDLIDSLLAGEIGRISSLVESCTCTRNEKG